VTAAVVALTSTPLLRLCAKTASVYRGACAAPGNLRCRRGDQAIRQTRPGPN